MNSNSTQRPRSVATLLTWISIASLILLCLTAGFGPQSGLESLVIIIPLLATLALHVLLGPIALYLSWHERRGLATLLIWLYFMSFALVSVGYWAWHNEVPLHARTLWRDMINPVDAMLSDTIRGRNNDPVADTESIRAALAAGADAGHVTPELRTPLIEAVMHDNTEALKLLLDAGADPNQRGGATQTPLFIAAANLRPSNAKILLDAGADPTVEVNFDSPLCRVIRTAGQPILPDAQQSLVTYLIDAGALGSGRCGQAEGPTSYYLAIQYGMRGLVKQLVAAGRKIAHRGDQSDLGSVLYDAVHRGELAWTKLLLQAGVSADAQTRNQRTALEVAVGAGKLDFARLLLSAGADPRKRPYVFQISRLSSDQTKVMELLLAAGASPDDGAGGQGGALYQAASHGRARQVQLLLQAGADRDARNNQGTPLLIALQTIPAAPEKESVIQVLIQSGANLEAADSEGRTALMVAVQRGNVLLAEQLYRAGAHLDAFDNNGRSAAHLAMERFDAGEIVAWLAQQGADFVRKDKLGQSPICLATAKPRNKALRALLEAGVNGFECDNDADDALLQAVSRRDIEALKLLLRFGADPDKRNSQDISALEESARRGFQDGFVALLAAGANPNTLVRSGHALLPYTAIGQQPWRYPAERKAPRVQLPLLTAALLGGYLAVIEPLLRAGADTSFVDSSGATPLLALASAKPGTVNITEGVKRLIAAGTDNYHADWEGFTPATRAAQRDRVNLLLAMSQAGVDLNVSDPQGRQVVTELAARTYQAEKLRQLIEAGLRSTQGAVAKARERRANTIVRVLESGLRN